MFFKSFYAGYHENNKILKTVPLIRTYIPKLIIFNPFYLGTTSWFRPFPKTPKTKSSPLQKQSRHTIPSSTSTHYWNSLRRRRWHGTRKRSTRIFPVESRNANTPLLVWLITVALSHCVQQITESIMWRNPTARRTSTYLHWDEEYNELLNYLTSNLCVIIECVKHYVYSI